MKNKTPFSNPSPLAAWQDVIYTTAVLVCLYAFLRERPTWGMIAFGLAISTKLQAIFLVPFLLILYLQKKTSLASFLLIPGTYLLTLIPAWLIGRPLPDLLTIYLAQGETYRELTMNAPNLYTWLPNTLYDILVPAGLLLTILIALGRIAVAHKNRTASPPSTTLVALATLSVLTMPFFLPKMHDRYFYPADVFSLILGFYAPQLFLLPVFVQFVSLFAYYPFLFQAEPIRLEILAGVQLFSIGWLLWHLRQS